MYLEALNHHKNSEDLYVKIVNNEISRGRFAEAQDILKIGTKNCSGTILWKKAAKLHKDLNNLTGALDIINQAIEKFPNEAYFYALGSKILKKNDIEAGLKLLEKGQKVNPTSGKLWIEASKIEESKNNEMMARYLLEKGRKSSKDANVWIYSVKFELKTGNQKPAQFILNKALQEFPKEGKL